MRRLLIVVALIAAGAMVASCGSSAASGKSFADAVASPDTVILDVRTPAEYAEGHIPGAINIDVEGPGFEQGIAGLDPAATYAVYCRSGRRSKDAVAIMTAAGFRDLAELQGGILTWDGPLTAGSTP